MICCWTCYDQFYLFILQWSVINNNELNCFRLTRLWTRQGCKQRAGLTLSAWGQEGETGLTLPAWGQEGGGPGGEEGRTYHQRVAAALVPRQECINMKRWGGGGGGHLPLPTTCPPAPCGQPGGQPTPWSSTDAVDRARDTTDAVGGGEVVIYTCWGWWWGGELYLLRVVVRRWAIPAEGGGEVYTR